MLVAEEDGFLRFFGVAGAVVAELGGEDTFGGAVDMVPCCYVAFLEGGCELADALLGEAFFDVLAGAEGQGGVAEALTWLLAVKRDAGLK